MTKFKRKTIKSENIIDQIKALFDYIDKLKTKDKVEIINKIKILIHEHSPFSFEPVDCIQWVPIESICANDYNPNVVAPPEMKLLKTSIESDGYTQPIVAWKIEDGKYEVVDGFHRNRVGREYIDIKTRIKGYLPLAIVNQKTANRGNRIASTIRHNRARGKHTIEGMSDIVIELKNRNWKNERIARELGMDEDEILRLCQITGLSDLFSDEEFSKSWDIEDSSPEFIPLSDDIDIYGEETEVFRTVNTNDPQRIFHTHDKWECHKSGFYNTTKDGMTKKQCEKEYANFLSNTKEFEEALKKVTTEWKFSCEHYLTNKSMNRIAWLGQASVCYAKGIPAIFRGGFYLLTEEQQDRANKIALIYLNKWLKKNGLGEVTLEQGLSGKQMELY